MSDANVEEIVKQLVHNNKEAIGVIICKADSGIVIRTTISQAKAVQYVGLYLPIIQKTKKYLEEVHHGAELDNLRVRSKKYEIIASENSMDTVVVTGASGYVASHCIVILQKHGYRVRGTVRDLSNAKKIDPLRRLCPDAKYPLELIEADLTGTDEQWRQAVRGCTYVMHVASPFPAKDPKDKEEELIKPAVEGTLKVLRACADVGGVKRVVLTSSMAAICGEVYPNYERVHDETEWTDLTKEVAPYQESKTRAERAAWEFIEHLPQEKKFELAVINPVYVQGPVLHGSTGTSQEIVFRLLTHAMPAVPNVYFEICDVRDVALAHYRAMLEPAAAGGRHIVYTGNISMRDIGLLLKKEFEQQGYNIPTMQAPNLLVCALSYFDATLKMVTARFGKQLLLDNTRMRKVLKIEPPTPLEETFLTMAYTMIDQGYVPKSAKYTPNAKFANVTLRLE